MFGAAVLFYRCTARIYYIRYENLNKIKKTPRFAVLADEKQKKISHAVERVDPVQTGVWSRLKTANLKKKKNDFEPRTKYRHPVRPVYAGIRDLFLDPLKTATWGHLEIRYTYLRLCTVSPSFAIPRHPRDGTRARNARFSCLWIFQDSSTAHNIVILDLHSFRESMRVSSESYNYTSYRFV